MDAIGCILFCSVQYFCEKKTCFNFFYQFFVRNIFIWLAFVATVFCMAIYSQASCKLEWTIDHVHTLSWCRCFSYLFFYLEYFHWHTWCRQNGFVWKSNTNIQQP